MSLRWRHVEWNRRMVLKLIEEWKQHKFMYDMEDSAYHNKNIRKSALQAIVTNLKCAFPEFRGNANDVKVKMRNLRVQYVRELGKCSKLGASGYHPRIYFFSKMAFLQKYIQGHGNESHLEDSANEYNPIVEADNDLQAAKGRRRASNDFGSNSDDCSSSHAILASEDEFDLKSVDSDNGSISPYSQGNTTKKLRTKTTANKRKSKHSPSKVAAEAKDIVDVHAANTALQAISKNFENTIDGTFAVYIKHEMMTIADNALKSEMRDKIVSAIFEHKRRDKGAQSNKSIIKQIL